MSLILASASPRRQELLSHLGVHFEVVVSGFDEPSISAVRPAALAKQLAAAKAGEGAAAHPGATVLAADTVVALAGRLLGKPDDPASARRMLHDLRGRVHRVTTGVALLAPGAKRPLLAHVVTRVRMRRYTDAEVDASIEAGIPFDKAGGYGIQDAILYPVQACEGCYCNVMGLPLWTVVRMLHATGLHVDTSALPERCATCPDRTVAGQALLARG